MAVELLHEQGVRREEEAHFVSSRGSLRGRDEHSFNANEQVRLISRRHCF